MKRFAEWLAECQPLEESRWLATALGLASAFGGGEPSNAQEQPPIEKKRQELWERVQLFDYNEIVRKVTSGLRQKDLLNDRKIDSSLANLEYWAKDAAATQVQFEKLRKAILSDRMKADKQKSDFEDQDFQTKAKKLGPKNPFDLGGGSSVGPEYERVRRNIIKIRPLAHDLRNAQSGVESALVEIANRVREVSNRPARKDDFETFVQSVIRDLRSFYSR